MRRLHERPGQVLVAVLAVAAFGGSPALHAEPLFEQAGPGVGWTFDVGDRKQLFLDDLLIAEFSGISKFQGRPAKYPGNPIIVADKP